MSISYKIKRLLIISVAIIILAIAANEGSNKIDNPISTHKRTPYPNIPADIDQNAIDSNMEVKPKSSSTKAISQSNPPLISAEAYLVGNLETGEIYAEHNIKKIFPIASLSKLITALIALHIMQSDQKITITQSMLDGYGEAGHLVLGETLTVSELLYPLLLESSNDAAEAIAQSYGYDNFVKQMKAFTSELNMTSTSFQDASGLNSRNSSNSQDLFILSRYLYEKEKPLLEITRQIHITLASTTEHGEHIFNTINPFPLDPHFIGGKTGRTNEAKESMISLFRYFNGTMSYPVAIIVLRSDFKVREIDSSILFEQFIKKIGIK